MTIYWWWPLNATCKGRGLDTLFPVSLGFRLWICKISPGIPVLKESIIYEWDSQVLRPRLITFSPIKQRSNVSMMEKWITVTSLRRGKTKSEEACFFLKGHCVGRLRPSLGVGVCVCTEWASRGQQSWELSRTQAGPNTTLLGLL